MIQTRRKHASRPARRGTRLAIPGRILAADRQSSRRVDMRLLSRIVKTLLVEHLGTREFELNVCLLNWRDMARLNERCLGHAGSTDVITFDYSDGAPGSLSGEIVICIDEAISQARRFCTTWQAELTRYAVHGVLHLCGYDDRKAASRIRMKREEDRLCAELARQFEFGRL